MAVTQLDLLHGKYLPFLGLVKTFWTTSTKV